MFELCHRCSISHFFISGFVQFTCVELRRVQLLRPLRHRPDRGHRHSTVCSERNAQSSNHMDHYLRLVKLFNVLYLVLLLKHILEIRCNLFLWLCLSLKKKQET